MFMSRYFEKYKSLLTASFILATAVFCACNSSDNSSANTVADTAKNADTTNTGEWISLYNGKNLEGWHSYGKDSAGSSWKAEDSAIHLDATTKKAWQTSGGGDLVTNEEFENFDLKLEWKISEAGNSGIIFYIHDDTTKYKNTWQSGMEMQIADNEKNEDGRLEKHRAGDLYDLMSSSSAKVVKPAGQWNQVEIRSDRGKLDFFMNGQQTLSTTLWDDSWQRLIDNSKFKTTADFGTYKKGCIALQDHGADVWFRNISIKKL